MKITVVRMLKPEEVIGTDKTNRPEEFGVCPLFKAGDEYMMRNPIDFPTDKEGKIWPCAWSFADIQREISHVMLGGDYLNPKEKGVAYSCCTDGFRPVIFRVERIEA